MTQMEYVDSFSIKEESGNTNVLKSNTCHYSPKSILPCQNQVRNNHFHTQSFDCENCSLETYHCNHCNCEFDTIINFRKHVNGTLRNYTCRKCPYMTHSPLHWLRHSRMTHERIKPKNNQENEKPDKEFKCDQCQLTTKWPQVLKRHVLLKHTDNTDRKWFECDNCPFKAIHESRLKRHFTETHTNEKIRCSDCGFETKWVASLRYHKLTKHTNDEDKKWIQCDKCEYKTFFKPSFNVHWAAKHGKDDDKKWFQCDKCSYKTANKSHFDIHYFFTKHPDQKDDECECDMCVSKSG